MGRAILAVIVSYIAMIVLIVVPFMALWFGLGPNGLLQPNSFKGNMIITIAAPAITVIAGVIGGVLCAKIARRPKPVIVLAAIVLVLGLLQAYSTLQKPFPADPRDPNMTVEELMKVGREPTWVAIFNPNRRGAGGAHGRAGPGQAKGPSPAKLKPSPPAKHQPPRRRG